MTLNKAGFPGTVNDIQWAKLLDLLGNDGTSGMFVDPADGDRTVSVSSGISNVGGILADLDAAQNVGPMPANVSSNPKINRIILRAVWATKSLTLTWREGTPGSNPQPPDLAQFRRRGDQWEVPLAQVRLDPGHGAITSGDITRENTPPATGVYFITSIAQAPDPALGALIYYSPQQSLRIGTPSGYVEVANARPQPLEVRATTTTTQGGLGTSYEAGATACQVSFVASESGAVQVQFGGYVVTTSPGVRTTLSVQVRQGASEVLAPHADYSVAAGEVVTTGQESVVSGSNWVDVTGLTPGVTYTARTMAHCTISSGGRIEARRIRVRHIPAS